MRRFAGLSAPDDEPIALTPPTCAECGRPWFDASERWRSLLAVDDSDQLEPGEVAVYCPACAQREFGR